MRALRTGNWSSEHLCHASPLRSIPTGHLHVGNARTALFNWLLARHDGGTFILRIEDTDVERSTRESERAILDDLRVDGAARGTKASSVGGDSARTASPSGSTSTPTTRGSCWRAGTAYYCFCSPEKLEAERQAMLAQGLPPKYAGTCRAIRARRSGGARGGGREGRDPAARARRPRGGLRRHRPRAGDLSHRRDRRSRCWCDPTACPPTTSPSSIDDALMQVTHVVRGEDHISNTPRQVLLYEAFGWQPPAFAHLSLVMGPDHTPLSKRHGATSVAEFRAKGYLPEALVNYLALIGWSPGEGEELLPLDELARRFDLSKVAHSAGVFDEDKLAWVEPALSEDGRSGAAGRSVAAVPARAVDGGRRAVATRRASGCGRSFRRWRLQSIACRRFPIGCTRSSRSTPPSRSRETAIRRELDDAGRAVVAGACVDELASVAAAHRSRRLPRGRRSREGARPGRRAGRSSIRFASALTGEAEGPELDLLVPAIDRAADLSPAMACSR